MDFNRLEQDVMSFWEAQEVFSLSVKNRRGCLPFVMYEGPPTANGKPGLHHVMTRTFKDIVARYQTMKGRLVERKAGWDEHGLPVEIEVQKSLGLKTKVEIERYGVGNFNAACQASTTQYIAEWEKFTRRMGYWVDMDHAYKTSSPEYVTKVWGVLSTLFDQGLVYNALKVVPWACDSGTVVSNAETNEAYKDVTDMSAYVKFRLEGEDTFLLAWTTTPWTLPGNMALAVHPDLTYKCYNVNGEHIVSLLDLEGELTGTVAGRELAGKKYHPLFGGECLPVYAATFVLNEKTGVVHIAPAFGVDDYDLHMLNTPDKAVVCHLDLDGTFNDAAPDFLRGRKVFSQTFEGSNALVVSHLGDRVFKTEAYTHSYPHNWRTGKPLVYMLRPTWYFATSRIKDKLLAANAEVQWHPPHIKNGRFGYWLSNNVDWAISRERFWGTPLPFGQHGFVTPPGVHRPEADVPERTPEVLDCWFDSGAMPWAAFDEYRRADFVCEAVDQTRGWFYTLLAIGVAVEGESPYKTVLCLGHLLDKAGQKMSKSKGNAVDPWMLFEKYGADAVRWFMAKTTVGNSVIFTESDLRGNSVSNRLINCLAFYQTYAGHTHGVGTKSHLDLWLEAAQRVMVRECDEAYARYDISVACEVIDKFVDQLSNVWLRASRGRFSGKDSADDAAYGVLASALTTTCEVAAPVMPFLAEHVWKQLNAGLSVHLTDFPGGGVGDEKLLAGMVAAQAVITAGRRLRDDSGVKLRQPLASVSVPADYNLGEFESFVMSELNVKRIVVGVVIALDTNLTEELLSEGVVRDFMRAIQAMRKDAGLKVTDAISLSVDYQGDEVLERRISSHIQDVIQKLQVAHWCNSGEGQDIKIGDSTMKVSLSLFSVKIQ